jgi:S1-C subfamily serine protease
VGISGPSSGARLFAWTQTILELSDFSLAMDAPGRSVIASRRITKLRCVLATLFTLMALNLPERMTHSVLAQESENSPSGMGTIGEYVQDGNARESAREGVREIPDLGIVVRNGTGKLQSGAILRGPIVTSVIPDGPAGRAGLRNQHDIARPVLMGVFIAGSLVFPPAFFGAAVVAASDLGESHDTIIAVDSERTRDVQELEDAVARSHEGPILYLSVIRGGRRSQIQAFVRAEDAETEHRVQN